MVTGWQIVRRNRSGSTPPGEGARLHGGRWNSPGIPMIYLSDSPALAALEILVHLNPQIPADYVCIRIEWPRACMAACDAPPPGWDVSPAGAASQRLGDQWATARRSAVLSVPSAIVPGHRNYLLHPRHRDFTRVVIHPPQPLLLHRHLSS